ncbi:hypothetical protein [Bradyrhizobium zhanjiangense]|uniref:hypothetical protein n=1 Tax=Bradyrhizobium zhanjiangense TaxID=1325107 RepID=UPI001008CC92|nr:hypothetical protein [Bradyrhizobium zhanjiangense]
MAESTNSTKIIDLDAYRSMRRQRKIWNLAGPGENAAAGPSMSGFAMPLFWFWPTWFWVPMGAAVTSAVGWDAS